jgi:DNA-binding LytR/AlgR family response regulator
MDGLFVLLKKGEGVMERDFIPIFTRQETTKVYLNDIIHIRHSLRTTEIFTRARRYRFYKGIGELMPMLDGRFLRCYCSSVINLEKVESARNGVFHMEGGEAILMSRDKFQAARKIYVVFLLEVLSGRTRFLMSAVELM